MKLRLKIPFQAYISDSSEDKLDPNTAFDHAPYRVSMSFEGQQALSSDQLPEEIRHFRWLTNIVLEVSDTLNQDSGGQGLEELVSADQQQRLAKLLVFVVNRVLRAIRNFGTVVHVNEIQFSVDEAKSLLRRWGVEISKDGNDWEPLFEPLEGVGGLAGLLRLGSQRGQQVAELRATR